MSYRFSKNSWRDWLLLLLLLAIVIEFFRDIVGTGDFVGYVNAGNNVLKGLDIYGDYLNTWPPLFSVFSVPLALLDNVNGVVNRAIWLAASIWALYWIISVSVELLFHKKLLFPFKTLTHPDQISFSNSFVLIPFLLVFRYVLDNMANIQINIFMLAMALGSLYFILKNREILAAFLLALSVSLKVYTLFLIPFYLYKKKYRMVFYTLCWIALLGAIPFLVFGHEMALHYYHTFYIERAQPFAMVLHKNQSLFAMFRGLLMNESRGFDIYMNITHFDVHLVKKISYAIVAIIASIVLFLFAKDKKNDNESLVHQTFFVLTCIPILSPLAWKAYFIFLWPGYFWVYYQLWSGPVLHPKRHNFLKLLFAISLVGTVLSSELFVGSYVSDLFEIYASITLGTVLLLLIYLIRYSQINHKQLNNNNLNNY